MLERPITVTCYHCLETFDCNYLGYPVNRKCPSCSVVNKVPEPDIHGKSLGVKAKVHGKIFKMG